MQDRDAMTHPAEQLSDTALMRMLRAATEHADAMGQPQCIVIVDVSAVELASFRMAGAKVLSLRSARAKAQTAASTGRRSADLPDPVSAAVAAATDGTMTGLPGGLPIWRRGRLLGGIGVGSGTGEQDTEVALAALAAIDATPA